MDAHWTRTGWMNRKRKRHSEAKQKPKKKREKLDRKERRTRGRKANMYDNSPWRKRDDKNLKKREKVGSVGKPPRSRKLSRCYLSGNEITRVVLRVKRTHRQTDAQQIKKRRKRERKIERKRKEKTAIYNSPRRYNSSSSSIHFFVVATSLIGRRIGFCIEFPPCCSPYRRWTSSTC